MRAFVALKVIQFVIAFAYSWGEKKKKNRRYGSISLFLISSVILIFPFQK